MTGIVVTGGETPDFTSIQNLFQNEYYLVAADSGLDYCVWNSLTPDYVIGDMDSLVQTAFLNRFDPEKIEKHSEEKDFTDTELALNHLDEKKCLRKILIGGGGGRADHFLAIYSLFLKEKKPDVWITHDSYIQVIRGKVELEVLPESLISLFPLKSHCSMRSDGLYWPLDRLNWSPGDAGISNRAMGNKVKIEMERGELLMIRDLKSVPFPS